MTVKSTSQRARLLHPEKGGRAGLSRGIWWRSGDGSAAQADQGVLCCQGDSIRLQKKLINWLRCVLAGWLCRRACVRACAPVQLIHLIMKW